VVIPTGISDIFVPQQPAEVAAYRASLDERFPALRGKRILLFAGRITVEKDAKFLLPVLARVHSCMKDVALLFAGAAFTSAALVFMVEPMMAKLVLPRLGGAPAVWNTSLAFFQVAY